MPIIHAGDLEVDYDDTGPSQGTVVLLLHGWPDDRFSWQQVAATLNTHGLRTITPTLRGFGDTRFTSADAPRTGNSAILAIDAIALMDALRIDRFSVAGHDWGAGAAEALAVGWPERVQRLALLGSPSRLGGMSTPPFEQAQRYWYHWFMATGRGAQALRDDRHGFAHIHWVNWSPQGWFDETTFDRVARAFDNPDWVDVTLHSYRARWDNAEPDPRSQWLEDKIKATATLSQPTLYFQGEADGVNPPSTSRSVPPKFSGPFELISLPGVGHFTQREAPDAVAARLVAHFNPARDSMRYLAYSESIEKPDPDEAEAIAGIVKGMSEQTDTVAKREGHAVRASHAKSSACAVGEMTVAGDLPPELAQGLFARPGTYPVAVRFAQGPGETLGDRVSTHRGMAIKVFGVQGDKLPGHGADTQDFVLATGTTFPSGTAKGFLRDSKQIGATTPLPEVVKSAVSSAARNFNKLLHAFGTEYARADFFGHPYSHPLADAYFSQCPIRFGEHVAKLGVFPSGPAQAALARWQLDPAQDENGFRHASVAFLRDHGATFELRAQLWVDAEKQPIEDASVEWPKELSDYRTVAVIHLPPQEAYSAERQRYFDDVMTFRPAHSLQAHRPLGSVMRARLKVYQALSDLRHRTNGVTAENMPGIDKIPA